MTIVGSVTGEIICEALQRSEARGGTIVQTCGDGGGENVCGIRLFRESVAASPTREIPFEENSINSLGSSERLQKGRVILHAYDVPHKLACILRSLMKENKQWQAFISAAATSKSKVQLSDAAHLAPPNQRSKSRYMNLEELVTWGVRALDLVKRHATVMREGLKSLNTDCKKKRIALFKRN